MVLDIAVEHRLPELHCGPYHVLLHTAVSKLSNASSQFLLEGKKNSYKENEYQITTVIKNSLTISTFGHCSFKFS